MADAREPSVDVSVIVTNWNGRDVLGDCLRSLIRETVGVRYETIVVDDASTDGSAELVRKEFPDIRLLRNPVNAGFVRANNAGAETALGRYLFLLNSDTVLVNNAVRILADFLDRHESAGACGGMLLYPDGSPQISFGSEPSILQGVVDALFLNDLFPRAGFPARAVAPGRALTAPVAVDYVSGADLMIRRDFVKRRGLFDPVFEAYCEEVDLCRRIRREGNMNVCFVPDARITHLGGFSYGKTGRRRIRLQCRSNRTFLRKHHGPLYATIVMTLLAWHYAVKLLFRLGAWIAAPGEQKLSRRESVLDALYFLRYSIRGS